MPWGSQRLPLSLPYWRGVPRQRRYPAPPRVLFQICARYLSSTCARARQEEDELAELESKVLLQTTHQSIEGLSAEASDETESLQWLNHLQILDKFGQEASKNDFRLIGLVQSIRKQKTAAFAHVSDGTTLAGFQAMLSPEQALNITNGAYVDLIGKWRESRGKGQSHELQVKQVTAIGPSEPDDYPIQKKFQSLEYLRTIPHLRIRTSFQSLLARVRSSVLASGRNYFYLHGTIEVHPPIITSSDCEGAGEVFSITPQAQASSAIPAADIQQYFREPKYLTVSSQLHLEAFSAELGSVFALSPTFRAEESDTPRHLSEFYMLEAEYRGIMDLGYLMRRVEMSIKHIVKELRNSKEGTELLQYYADAKHRGDGNQVDLASRWDSLDGELEKVEWPKLKHEYVVEKLQAANSTRDGPVFQSGPSYTNGLQLEHERWIVANLGGGKPVFVTNYPKTAKPFYMLPSKEPSSKKGIETVDCFDLLLPFGYCEVVGGSLREHRLEQLISSMRECGMLKKRDPNKPVKESDYPFLRPGEDLGSLRWYADLRRFGTTPHGGYGLGFDRLLAYLTGVSNVRDVVAFPRTWGRADC